MTRLSDQPPRRQGQWFLLLSAAAVASAIASVSVSAQHVPDNSLLTSTQVTGDWGGARSNLEDHGIRFSLYFIHTYGQKSVGGLDPIRRGRHSISIDLFGQFDFHTMNVIRGGEALIHLKSNWGLNINPLTGALSDPIDDADGDHALYIDQLWYQQSTPARRVQVRFGYLDQQTILDRNAFANNEDRQFMSTFLDNNNAIVPLAIGPGLALFYNATEWLSIVATASDAKSRPPVFSFATVFDGEYFVFVETDLRARLHSANGPLTGAYRFGFFADPQDRIVFGADTIARHTGGFYLSLDQAVYAEPSGHDQGLGLFFRYGWRPADVNRLTHSWSGSLQYQGLIPRGEQQTLGVGVYSAIGSALYREHVDPTFDRETGWEVYYALPLSPAVVLTPALQYIHQPGGLTTRQSVAIIAIRGRISF